MIVHNSELGKLHFDLESKDVLINEITKENSNLKDKIDLLNVQINLLIKELKEKSIKANDSVRMEINSGTKLSASRRESSHMTGCFNENTSLNGLTDTLNRNSKVLKVIPTLNQEHNFGIGSEIHLSEEGSHADLINASIMLNLPSSKRLVLDSF
jgi:hypothetical protein